MSGAGFLLAASLLAFAASALNSVSPNEKKTSGTQGKYRATTCKILQGKKVQTKIIIESLFRLDYSHHS